MNVKSTKIKKEVLPKIDEEALSIKEEISQCFSGLYFNEEFHKYSIDGLDLTSVTTFIHEFTEPFPEWSMATNMSRNNIESQLGRIRDKHYYIRRWAFTRDSATNSGSRVHEYLEYNYPLFRDFPRCRQEQGGKDFLLNLPDNYEVIFAELKVFKKEWKIAGTVDLLIYNKDTGNLVIADWKTNETNLTQVYKNKKLKKPFDNLYAHDLNKYSLQLSLYKSIIEQQTRFKVEKMIIMHLSTNDRNELDFDKRHKTDRYHIEEIKPVELGDYYRVYDLVDYSPDLIKYLNDKQ